MRSFSLSESLCPQDLLDALDFPIVPTRADALVRPGTYSDVRLPDQLGPVHSLSDRAGSKWIEVDLLGRP